jgi:hypothetical protein
MPRRLRLPPRGQRLGLRPARSPVRLQAGQVGRLLRQLPLSQRACWLMERRRQRLVELRERQLLEQPPSLLALARSAFRMERLSGRGGLLRTVRLGWWMASPPAPPGAQQVRPQVTGAVWRRRTKHPLLAGPRTTRP